jgi:O-antigen/teichoic acid export membrane protein
VWWGTAAVGSFALLIPVAQGLSLVAVARPRQASTAVRAEGVAAADSVDIPSGTVDSTQAPMGWLIVGAVLAQVLVNAPPVLARVLARSDPAVVGHLQAGLLLARVPLFMFAAIQAVLLPSMAALVARRQLVALRRQIRAVSVAVAVVMSATIVLMGLVGTSIVKILFGDSFQLPGVTIALLSAGTAFFMLAGVSSSAVLAIGRFRAAAMAWGAGAAVMGGFTLLPLGVVARLVVGFAAGSVVSFALMAVLVRASTRASRRAEPRPGPSGVRLIDVTSNRTRRPSPNL